MILNLNNHSQHKGIKHKITICLQAQSQKHKFIINVQNVKKYLIYF